MPLLRAAADNFQQPSNSPEPSLNLRSIGLIGGLSWESTTLYYQTINREVGRRLGGLRSASITIHSLDFEPISALQKAGDWDAMARLMGRAGRRLADGGAQCVLIGSNTMHRVADAVQAEAGIPLLHIADALAAAVLATPVRTVGLLGTRMTMELPFYVEHLARHGIRCITPDEAQREAVHRIIFGELFLGQVRPESRARLAGIVDDLVQRGAEGMVLGCTELPMILRPEDSPVPLFDTTRLHALAAVDFSLQGVAPAVEA